jgi:hypothetical protein
MNDNFAIEESLEDAVMLCYICGEMADRICEKCEEPICGDCQAEYNQFSQIDYDCCERCANTQPD